MLVKGWKASATWGFPKGKIDQEEDDADCAVREVRFSPAHESTISVSHADVGSKVREECGFDIAEYIKEKDYVDMVMKEQSVRLYVVRGIPSDTKFEPQTRKEISVCETPVPEFEHPLTVHAED